MEYLTGIGESNIRQIIYNKIKTSKGFHFSLFEKEKEQVLFDIIKLNQTEEYSKKISILTSGSNNPMFNKKHSNKTIQLIKEKLIGKPSNTKRICENTVVNLYKNNTQLEISKFLNCSQANISEILTKNEIRKFTRK